MKGILRELSGTEFEGYEIHMGKSSQEGTESRLVEFSEETGAKSGARAGESRADGAQKGNVYGCYIHGIFDAPDSAKGFVSALLKKNGYDAGQIQVRDWKAYKEEQYDKLADIIRESLDMEQIYQIIEKGNDMPCSL